MIIGSDCPFCCGNGEIITDWERYLHALPGDRAMIRFSNAKWPIMATVPITAPDQCPPDAFVCPEQTGRTRACATCAACWGTQKNVAFIAH